jgi:molecular chaperone DnaJ
MTKSDDPYTLLGLHATATQEEVKRAYRRLAMRWHPDRNPSAAAESEFKRVKEAYELILDPQRYRQWQQTAAAAPTPKRQSAPEPAPTGDDITQTLTLTLEEAAHGCSKSIELARNHRCVPCQGSGRLKYAHSIPCTQCSGIGRVRSNSQGSALCQGCGGRGYLREAECGECAGSGWHNKLRTLSVKVPPGILHGERLRLARQARYGAAGEGAAGDLYLEIRLAPHALFTLEQRDLHCTVPVSIFRLLSGGEMVVPTLSGSTTLDLRPFTGQAADYRLPGHGFPKKHGRGSGDLFLQVQPVYPVRLNAKDRALLDRLEAALNDKLAQCAPPLADWAARLNEQNKQP